MARKKQPVRQPRRKRGSGAVRHRPGRDLPFEAAFPLGGGRYRYDAFATAEDAAAHLDRLTAERDSAETPRNVAGGSQRVDTFLRGWLEMKSIRIKPGTLADYNYQCTLAVERIGGLRLDEVTRETADALITYYARRRYQNIAQLLMVMKAAFHYAEDAEYIRKNPFAKITPPAVVRREAIALSVRQRDTLLTAAAIEDVPAIPLCPLWHLYSRLGLRRGEGIALRWGDLDERAAVLHVRRTTSRAWALTTTGTPKSPRGTRSLPVPPDLLQLLLDHKAAQTRRAAADPAWRMTGYMFVDAHGAQVVIGHVEGRWKKIRARAGLPVGVRMHDLRHTALTILEKSGTPASIVQAFAGHSSATMTRHYTDHTTVDQMRAAIEKSA